MCGTILHTRVGYVPVIHLSKSHDMYLSACSYIFSHILHLHQLHFLTNIPSSLIKKNYLFKVMSHKPPYLTKTSMN